MYPILISHNVRAACPAGSPGFQSLPTPGKLAKSFRFLIISTVAAITMVFANHASSQPVPPGLRVKLEGKAEYGEGRSESKIQYRSLVVDVSNSTKTDMPAVEVRWAIYGKTMDGNTLKEISSNSETRQIPAGQTVTLQTPELGIEGARKHAVASGGGRRKKFKEVPASGERYYGYAVELLVGGRVVASDYSQPSLKNQRQDVP